jgi:hypothetical protein
MEEVRDRRRRRRIWSTERSAEEEERVREFDGKTVAGGLWRHREEERLVPYAVAIE